MINIMNSGLQYCSSASTRLHRKKIGAISGLVSYRHLSAIKRYFEKETQAVRAVHQRSYLVGNAELIIDYSGKSSNIADGLANRKFTGFRLEPLNVTPNRLDFKAVLDE